MKQSYTMLVLSFICLSSLIQISFAADTYIIDTWFPRQFVSARIPYDLSTLPVVAGNTVAGSMIGGERDIEIVLTGGVTGREVLSSITNDEWAAAFQKGTLGTIFLVYDGIDNNPFNINVNGLGGFNFTQGGGYAFRFVAMSDLPTSYLITVIEMGGVRNATYNLTLPGMMIQRDVIIPFTTFQGYAASIFTNAGALVVQAQGGDSVDSVIRLFSVFANQICGTVFIDCNEDGFFDITEVGFNGLNVELKNLQGKILASGVTNSSGQFVLNTSPAKNLSVCVTIPGSQPGFPDEVKCQNIELEEGEDICNLVFSADVQTHVTAPPDIAINCTQLPVPAITGNANVTACGNYTLTYNDTAIGDCPIVITRVFVAVSTQDEGSDVQIILIEDNTPPVFNYFPGDFNVTCGTNISNPNTLPGGSPTAVDDCHNVTITFHDTPVSGPCPVVISRLWTATDFCGNFVQRPQIIRIIDSVPPNWLFFPTDKTAECTEDTSPERMDRPTAKDDCNQLAGLPTWTDTISNVTSGSDCTYRITRRWRVADICGNFVERDQIITVRDTRPPVFTSFPADVHMNCLGDISDSVRGRPTATDACHSVTISFVDSNSGSVCLTNITRTWTAVDACGNAVSQVQYLLLTDSRPPTFVEIPADRQIPCGASSEPSATGRARATDDCGTANVTFSDDLVDMACNDTIVRTWSAVDQCGNLAQVQQTITIYDIVAPVFLTFPPDAVLPCNNSTSSSVLGQPTVSDDCSGIQKLDYKDVVSGTACVRVITRVWKVLDNCGNSAQRNQTITVSDQVPPVILTFPPNVNLSCEADLLPAALGIPTARDDCVGMDRISSSDSSRTGSACDFSFIRTWTFADLCGNVVTRPQSIHVSDTKAPVFTMVPGPITLECPEDLNSPKLMLATAEDNCQSSVQVLKNDVPLNVTDCFKLYNRTFTADDRCGNLAVAWQLITIRDTTPPTFRSFPPNRTLECDQPFSVAALGGLPSAVDSCNGPVLVTSEDLVSGSNCTQTIRRVFRAVDKCGNFATQVQVIVRVDTQPPQFTSLPANRTVECPANFSVAANGRAVAIDACDASPRVTFADSQLGDSCLTVLTRTWTAVDACGNVAVYVQMLTSRDTTPPAFTNFPGSFNGTCLADFSPAAAGTPGGLDNCSALAGPATFNDSRTGDSCLVTVRREWTIRDVCGNSARQVQILTLQDVQPPVFASFPADVTVRCLNQTGPEFLGRPNVTDDCNFVQLAHFDYPRDLSNLCRIVFKREWVAEDACGHQIRRNQTITIIDDLPPSFVDFPGDLQLPCIRNVSDLNLTGRPTSTDQCNLVNSTTFSDSVSGDSCSLTVRRTWTIRDICGNSVSRVQIIVLADTLPPSFTSFPEDATFDCLEGTGPAAAGTPTAADQCSLVASVSYSDVTEGFPCAGSVTRTWVATDACGNQISRVQILTLSDSTPPVLQIPADVNSTCLSDNSPSSFGIASATDNCEDAVLSYNDIVSGNGCDLVITRVWVASDSCGNTAQDIQTLRLVDNEAPFFIVRPADATVECGDLYTPDVLGFAQADDRCTSAFVSYLDLPQDNNTCVHLILRNWTAVDECGNSASFVQRITIRDTTAPEFAFPFCANVTLNCEEIFEEDLAGIAGATDACNAVVLAFQDSRVPGQCQSFVNRRWTATDACGNVAVLVQQISVVDNIPPYFIFFPADTNRMCNESSAPEFTGIPTFNDSCTPASLSHKDRISGDNCTTIINREWAATDLCGNIRKRTQIIVVMDMVAPVLSLPADRSVECGADLSPASLGSASAVDNCQLAYLNYTDAVEGALCSRVISRTWYAHDGCGNVASGVQLISLQDTAAPFFTSFPSDTSAPCRSNTAPSALGFAHGDDLCTDAIVSFSDSLSGDSCNRVLLRTWKVVDACGHNATRVQRISLQDTEAPFWVDFPENLTLSCNDRNNTGYPAASDLCSPLAMPFSSVDSVVSDNGCRSVINRRWTVADVCGNSISRTQQLTFLDNSAPHFIFYPVDTTIECDKVNTTLPAPSAVDDCTTVSLSFKDTVEGNSTCLQTIHRNWTASDPCGNAYSQLQRIKVVDSTAPYWVSFPANVTVACSGSTLPNVTGVAVAADNCAAQISVSFYDAMQGVLCPEALVIHRNWVAVDLCGNVNHRVQVIKVSLDLAPVLSVPANISVPCQLSDVAFTGFANGSSPCGVEVGVTYRDFLQVEECPGRLLRLWRAEDACGNYAEGEQWITLVDAQPPSFTSFPADVSVDCGDCLTPNCTGYPGVMDLCDLAVCGLNYKDHVFNASIAFGFCPPDLVIVREWIATDRCGNEVRRNQTINVGSSSTALPCPVQNCTALPCTPQECEAQQPCPNCDCEPFQCLSVPCRPVTCAPVPCMAQPCIPCPDVPSYTPGDVPACSEVQDVPFDVPCIPQIIYIYDDDDEGSDDDGAVDDDCSCVFPSPSPQPSPEPECDDEIVIIIKPKHEAGQPDPDSAD